MKLIVQGLNKVFTASKRKGLFRSEKVDFQALSNINFELTESTILTIIGANGAGKTTLIKIMLGLIAPTEGTVKINEFNPYMRDKSYLKQIGFVSGQKRVLKTDLTPFDSIFSSCLFYDMEIDEINTRFDELAKLFKVDQKINTLVRNLSLGETIKFEIILAIMHKPKLLFLDEPTIGLDFESQKIIISTLKKLHIEENTMVILTSHYPKDIKELSKKILIIEKGSSTFFGDFKELTKQNADQSTYINQFNKELKAYDRDL